MYNDKNDLSESKSSKPIGCDCSHCSSTLSRLDSGCTTLGDNISCTHIHIYTHMAVMVLNLYTATLVFTGKEVQ